MTENDGIVRLLSTSLELLGRILQSYADRSKKKCYSRGAAATKVCSAAKFAPPQSPGGIPREDSKGAGLKHPGIRMQSGNCGERHWRIFICYFVFACLSGVPTRANSPRGDQIPSPGFSAELSGSSAEVIQALNEVLEDQIIHGTHVFDKEPTLTGARVAASTPLFEPWNGPGRVFYKIRKDVVAPRHFRESEDMGTIAVRYVVTSAGEVHTRIHIAAIFVETAHRRVHASDGTVESSEFKAIQEHLQAIQFAAQEAADAKRRRDSAELVRQTAIRQREDETTRLAAAQSSVQDLQQRISAMRHEVERRVKAPGADLKAAPFRAAAKVKALAAYTEVVVVIVTPHWYGVETPDGQRGWMPVDQLETLP